MYNKYSKASFIDKLNKAKTEVQRLKLAIATVLTITLLSACTDNKEFTPPSFIHVDGISIVASSSSGIGHGDAGFYTSDIVAAYVLAHYPGEMTLDTIGLFRLPFTVPVMYSGAVDYIEFYPAVPHSGESMALPFYTFYNKIRISDTVLRSGDTLNFGSLTTVYNPQTDIPMLYEPFEPTEADVKTDSVVEWVRHDRDGACVGEGYGRVKVKADQSSVPFAIDHTFRLFDRTKICYLEIDIKSTVYTEVLMHAAYTDGGSESANSVMRIYPQDEWQHLYINLGRTWAYFNHPTSFRLSFAALNENGVEGEVLIDNIKVLSTSVVL